MAKDKYTNFDWHPYAETFPLIEGADFDALVESIKATKGNAENPIVYRTKDGKMQGIDGRNRLRACLAAGVKPTMRNGGDQLRTDADVKAYIDRCNEHRRHMTKEQRAERIVKLREQGHTYEEIAEKVDASPATVKRELDKAADAPEPGKDLRCGNCIRKQPKGKSAPNCEKCAANKKAAKAKAEPETKPDKPAKPERGGKTVERFDWAGFDAAYGGMCRNITRMAKLYKCDDTPKIKGLRNGLKAWKENFRQTYESVSQLKAPKK